MMYKNICNHVFNLVCIGFLLLGHLGFCDNDDSKTMPNDPAFTIGYGKQYLYNPTYKTRPWGHINDRDWQTAIDSVWGPGLPTATKLQIFDEFWMTVDSNFASFNNLVVNWDSLRTVYRTEIEDTVSRGRFAAIMNYLAMALMDGHTVAEDWWVNWSTLLEPGIPLFAICGWTSINHFGAGLTPLVDSSLLVYKNVFGHPLGVRRGDIILGYDGIPWKTLYKDLMSAQLPYRRFGCWGSSESTLTHTLLMGAGMNWHLFDTLDIVKYQTGDTLHLSVTPLIGQSMSLYCTEQMDIPGVAMPNLSDSQLVSYGVITGQDIGYIYSWGWFYYAEDEFYNALFNLTNNSSLKGIIIDFRFNMGGNMFLSNKGLQLLFRDSVATICFSHRDDPHNHFSMYVAVPESVYVIPGNDSAWYSKPIAVLTGPGAVSSGDQVAFRMKYHPMVRIFGKSTNTAFNAPTTIDIHSDWNTRYSYGEACLANDTLYYLTHREFQVDEPVWLLPDDVAYGDDTVVEAAVDWINSMTINEEQQLIPQSMNWQLRIHPNPVVDKAVIEIVVNKQDNVSIKVYNTLGQEITTIFSGKMSAGHKCINWNANTLPCGIYFVEVNKEIRKKVIKIK